MAAKGKPDQTTNTNRKNCQQHFTHESPSRCFNSEICLVGVARELGTPSSLICLRPRRVNIILIQKMRHLRWFTTDSKFLETILRYNSSYLYCRSRDGCSPAELLRESAN